MAGREEGRHARSEDAPRAGEVFSVVRAHHVRVRHAEDAGERKDRADDGERNPEIAVEDAQWEDVLSPREVSAVGAAGHHGRVAD